MHHMKQYSSKIYTNGKYKNFYGWTVISMVKDRTTLKFLYNFINNDEIISKYFSALPTESYHMTILGIWNTGAKLLPDQIKNIEQNYTNRQADKIIEDDSKTTNFFNPKFCINELLHKIHSRIHMNTTTKIQIIGLVYTGNTIQIRIRETHNLDKINSLRDDVRQTCQIERKYSKYHITLAYQYQTLTPEDEMYLQACLQYMTNILKDCALEIEAPSVRYFSDMTKFIPYKAALSYESHKDIDLNKYY